MRTPLIQLLCLLIGPFYLWPGASDVISGIKSTSWPVVPGEISAKGIILKSSEPGTFLRSRRRTVYRVETQYTYEAEGRRLTGTRIFLKDVRWSSYRTAEEVLALYDRGTPVKVSYKPGEPETAVLQPGAQSEDWWTLAFGIVLCGIGVHGAISFWRYFKSDHFPE